MECVGIGAGLDAAVWALGIPFPMLAAPAPDGGSLCRGVNLRYYSSNKGMTAPVGNSSEALAQFCSGL